MKAVSLFLAYFLTLNAFAYPVGFKGQKDTASQYSSTINAPNRSITNQGASNSLIETRNTNLLANASFEHATYDNGWTYSGSATKSKETSVLIDGNAGVKIVAAGNGFDLSQVSTLYAAQLGGTQGVATVWVKSGDPADQVCAVVDNVDTNCIFLRADNIWKEIVIPFVMGTTNNGIRIKAGTSAGTTYIDNAFVGVMPATMMPEISQAQIAGEAYFAGAANCAWSRTSTTIGAFGTDADCPGPTIIRQNIGSWQTTDTDLPRITVNNLPPGEYKATFNISQFAGAVDNGALLAINDGSTTCYAQKATVATVASEATVSCIFTYTSSGNRVFEVYGASNSSSITINSNSTSPAGSGVKFILEYYPPKSKIYSGDTIYPHAQLYGTLSYAGIANCKWSLTNTAFTNFAADTDCSNATVTGNLIAPATKIPGFILPSGAPKGAYKIVARGGYGGGASGGRFHSFRLSDGTNVTTSGIIYESNSVPISPELSGQITYSSNLTSNTTVQIQGAASSGLAEIVNEYTNNALTFEVYYFPPKDNPIIGTFAGIEKCADDFECTDVFSAQVTSGGVVSQENLNWLNGNCTYSSPFFTCNFNSGIFNNTPNCVATTVSAGTDLSTDSLTSSSIRIWTGISGSAASAQPFTITCQKQGSDYKPKTAKAATTNEMMYVPNVTRPKTCYYAFGGASATLASPTVCAASPCVEVYDSCSAGTAPTRAGAGFYNDLTFANGTWKANTFIDCKVKSFNTTTADGRFSLMYFVTSDNTWSTNANGGYVGNVYSQNASGVASDSYSIVECTADAP